MKSPRQLKIKLVGERLAWFELASHLHMTVEHLQSSITYSEFLEWREFLKLDQRRDTKLDYYMAQIAAEIRKSFVKDPNTVKISEFLLRFATEAEQLAQATQNPKDARKQKAAMSKGAWFGALQMKVPQGN